MGSIDSTAATGSAGGLRFVTVVVPVRNRPEAITACLTLLQDLRYPADCLELVVVDDASTDHTPDAVRAIHGRLPPRLLRLPAGRGPGGARNAGVEEARGEIVAFLDSDALVEPSWLAELVAEFDDPSVAAAGGAVLQIDHGSWLQRYDAVRSPAYLGARREVVGAGSRVSYLSGASLLVRRDRFLAVGGFDPALRVGEDVDLVWRLVAEGRRVIYNPAGRVWLDHRDTFSGFLRRRMVYAGGESALLRRHPHTRRHHAIPVLPVAALTVVVAAALTGRPELAPLALLPILADTWLSRGDSLAEALRSEARELGSFLYHSARSVARYYAVPVAAAGLLAEPYSSSTWVFWGVLAAVLVAPPCADWLRLRPQLSVPAFVAAGLLDNLAYHAGVLAACVRKRTLAPLAVRVSVRLRRGRREMGPAAVASIRSE